MRCWPEQRCGYDESAVSGGGAVALSELRKHRLPAVTIRIAA
jgi:hypothetical protein